jgi:HEAT repeat protein
MSDGQFEALFQQCLTQTDAAYRSARDALLALGPAAVAPVEAKAGQPDWRTQMVAGILRGWLTQRPLFERVMADARADWVGRSPGRPVAGTLSSTRRGAMLTSHGPVIVPRLLEIVTKTHEYAPANGEALEAVMVALGYLRDQRAVLPLAELTRSSPEPGLRLLALGTLGALGDPRAFDAAQAVMADRDQSPVVRGAAAICLGQLRDRRATAALLAAAQDTSEASVLREDAVRGLGYLGDPAAAATLAAVLRAGDERLALAAVDALGKLGDAAAAQTLEEAARDHTQVAVRQAARDAREGLPA